jgi:hypothetical protein
LLRPLSPFDLRKYFMVKVTAETSTLPTLQNAAQLIPMQKLALAR